ncbi:hypothetical protein QBC34DRAFT_499971 [Podospora aff. communis PSN243]|uniref:chitinase n=1 Tax=Podospora aff. communis PSN243 TaxID=3040156 RepID=A0AAV9FZ22_9PEZI|nr:hypothetical protein QBC34DRAFT_499971 [Podospora aff. communis PSN243]
MSDEWLLPRGTAYALLSEVHVTPQAERCKKVQGICVCTLRRCDENCGAGCEAKSYCNTGDGPEWSQIDECPLRVCCSKWGWCGMTEELCGDKQVLRPSCTPTERTIRRVVGYYKGWAARRKCMSYRPLDIKRGAYTHINFAFAHLDPVTFAIVPADPGDVALYKELTDMKRSDSELKVYIALGGWAHDEPWAPTAKAFSRMVSSEQNQRAFFTSLISFLTTYNFDGIDVDWEYPTALESTGTGRHGLTLTLPVAYWYLQHFDIARLAPLVEFFNIMSYDLHGTWEENKNWTEPWLNSHTNLTEITEYLDLLWRNDINPDQVVLGLAFYSRTFGLANPSCTAHGGACHFHGGGAPGPCSNDVGTLMSAEVKQILDGNPGIVPALDAAAAVKIFTHNNAWITYDDAQTFQLKVEFAKSQCLGGVMVWALSQDAGQMYSDQLQAATGYRSPGLKWTWNNLQQKYVANPDEQDAYLTRPQCRCAGCGEMCGPGEYAVERHDTDCGWLRHGVLREYIRDPTGCKDPHHHLLCCPSVKPYPSCGWYGFWNGGCTGVCEAGQTQVGSVHIACHTDRPQAACCNMYPQDTPGEHVMRPVALHANCHWEGLENGHDCPRTSSDDCDDGTKLVASKMGPGGDICYNYHGRSLYCCGSQNDNKRWAGCHWQAPVPDAAGHCNPRCPNGQVRVVMESVPLGCSSGGRAFCCTPIYRTPVAWNVDADAQDFYDNAFAVYLQDPKCHSSSGSMVLGRSDADVALLLLPNATGLEAASVKRQPGNQLVPAQAEGIVVRYAGLFAAGLMTELQRMAFRAAWDFAMEQRPQFLPLRLHNIDSRRCATSKKFADDAAETDGFFNNMACTYIFDSDPEYRSENPTDSGGDDTTLARRRRRTARRQSRSGWSSSKPASADAHDAELQDEGEMDGMDAPPPPPDENGNWPEVAADGRVYPYHEVNPNNNIRPMPAIYTPFNVLSSRYPNGEGGDALIGANGLSFRYLVKSGCGAWQYQLDSVASKSDIAGGRWVSEHILKLQAFPRFLEAAISGRFVRWGLRGTVPVTQSANVHPSIIQHNFPGWLPFTRVPANWALALLGSTDFPEAMVVCESALNAMKTRIYRFFRPVSDVVWASCCTAPDQRSAEKMFAYLQRVFAVFDYYNDPAVKVRHKHAYDKVKDVLTSFDNVNANSHLADAWREYNILQANEMSNWANFWVMTKINLALWIWEGEARALARMTGLPCMRGSRSTL